MPTRNPISSKTLTTGATTWARRLFYASHGVFAVAAGALLTLPLAGPALMRAWSVDAQVAGAVGGLTRAPGSLAVGLVGLALLGAAALGGRFAAQGRFRGAWISLAAAMIVISLGFDVVVGPAANSLKSPKSVALG